MIFQARSGCTEAKRLKEFELETVAPLDRKRDLRSSDWIDVEPPAEVLFHKTLHSCTSRSPPSIPQTDHDLITGIEVAVDNIDDDRLLKRSFVTLLIEPNAERLNRGWRLPGEKSVGFILGTHIVVRRAVRSLKECPILDITS